MQPKATQKKRRHRHRCYVLLPRGASATEAGARLARSGRVHCGSALADEPDEVESTTGHEVVGQGVYARPAEGLALLSLASHSARAVATIVRSGQLPKGSMVVPDAVVRACGISDYARGYADGVADFARRLGMSPNGIQTMSQTVAPLTGPIAGSGTDEWWRIALGLPASRFTGRGVRVAVLDTGVSQQHPDLRTRIVRQRSFTDTLGVEDFDGHGTHCAGLIAGPVAPQEGARYGVAPEAELCIGRVLDAGKNGRRLDVLDGIAWAVGHGCGVVCLALGEEKTDLAGTAAFEEIAERALRAGTLLVAAAGNESARPAKIETVKAPANAPSIIAVGALQADLSLLLESNQGTGAAGAEVNFTAPGAGIRSADRSGLYRERSGTSQAAALVAGVAALWLEAEPALRGVALWHKLRVTARAVAGDPLDVGLGLPQPPL